MKLTKGKIRKLYSKKKQSRKRYKNTINGTKIKTFRKRHSLDLNKRTLKRISYGGAKLGDEITSGQQYGEGENSSLKTTILPEGQKEIKEQSMSPSPFAPGEITSEPIKQIILPEGQKEIKEQQEEQSASPIQQSASPIQQSASPIQQSAEQELDKSTSSPNRTSDEEGSDIFSPSKSFSPSQTLSNDESNDFYSDSSAIAQAFKTLADYVANNIAAKIKNGIIPPLVNASQTQAGIENLTASQTLASTQSEPAVEEATDNDALQNDDI